MTIVWGDSNNPDVNAALGSWCAAHIDGIRNGFLNFTSMGVILDNELIASLVYHNFDRKAGVIEISAASITPRWLTRPVLKAMFSYPFEELGCQMVVLRVSERNTRLMRILTAYSFDHVTVPRLRGRDEAERIFFLTDDAWRSNGFHKEH